VGKPIIRAPKFGKWLAGRRGPSRSLESVASRVRRLLEPFGVQFHRSALLKIEQEGRVPHALILFVLAQVYRVPAGALLDKVASELGFHASGLGDLPSEPLLSERALALARWFDTLHPQRQKAIADLLDVPALHMEARRTKKGN